MNSGANDKKLIIASARADIMLKLDSTATYESWTVIDTYIEQLEKALIEIREILNRYENAFEYVIADEVRQRSLQIINKVLGDDNNANERT